jgi:hypothetical protein
MIDTIHASVHNVPASAPKVAGYTTGTPDIVWTAADWAHFLHSKVRICQDEGSDQSVDVLDIEPGAATNANAATWARARKTQGHVPSFYTSVSNLTPLLKTLEAAGITSGYLWGPYGLPLAALNIKDSAEFAGHDGLILISA